VSHRRISLFIFELAKNEVIFAHQNFIQRLLSPKFGLSETLRESLSPDEKLTSLFG